jgi:hypothetical protein
MMDQHTPGQCDVCRITHFERNNYYDGKSLNVRDLTDEQRYFNEKRWLINRMVLGWGVVCGLEVCFQDGCLVVRPGLAIDCCGHEILVCAPQRIGFGAVAEALGLPLPTAGAGDASQTWYPPPAGYGPPPQQHGGYTTPPPQQGGAPQTPPTPYGQPSPQGTPTHYGAPAQYATPSQYGTPPPAGPQGPYEAPEPYGAQEPIRWALCLEYRECDSEPVNTGRACASGDRHRQYNRLRDAYRIRFRPWKDVCPTDHGDEPCAFDRVGRGMPLHQTLVSKSLVCATCQDCECVLLAAGTIDSRPGQRADVRLDDDAWKYRPLVYTNATLGALLRCVHDGLAHIETINWTPGSHFQADEFLDRLQQERLRVTFDQPMKARTVTNPRSCRLSIFLPNESNCPAQVLIPVDRIDYTDRTATYSFDDDCIERELRAACKRLRKPADVELVLHGSMIHNRQGRAVDAELIDEFPTGNGVEGGEFIAYFTVGP